MAYSSDDILLTVAYLQGERSVNSTTSAPRRNFIQATLNEIYGAYPWRFARALATVVFSNGIATLPTNYDISHPSHIKFNNGTDVTIDEINEDDSELFSDGDRAAWIYPVNADSEDSRYVLQSKDSDVSSASFKYQKMAPILDTAGTIKTQYPNSMTIALGARRYVKLGQNPDADVSQDEKIFKNRLAEDQAAHQVNQPRKHRRIIQNRTGDF